MKLSKKLTLSFIFTILLSIFAIFLISNSMINNRFENYLEAEQALRFDEIYSEINSLVINNELNTSEIGLFHYSMSETVNITIRDIEDNIVYDSKTSMGMGMGDRHLRMNMMNKNITGDYTEKQYTLTDGSNDVGTLIIGYMDNSHLTDSAIIFKDTLTRSLIISGVVAIIIGILVSIAFSKGLTRPLINITRTANKIRSGDLLAKSKVDTNTSEIVELSDTINYLGESLSRQESIRKRYASDISHELRTPITTLKTHLEAITDGVWEPNKEHLEILMNETNRLSGLVNDLKDTFIQEEYTLNLNKTSFNISEELEDVITSFKPSYAKGNYHLISSIEKNIVVLMDKDKFKQIVSNLLSNSLRYLNRDGEVNVSLKQIKKSLILTITDNGTGIKKEDLPFIFDRFYRADTSRNKNTGGTGLGLTIVKSIVEAHNGTLEIQSVYGHGTVVTIVLPINSNDQD